MHSNALLRSLKISDIVFGYDAYKLQLPVLTANNGRYLSRRYISTVHLKDISKMLSI